MFSRNITDTNQSEDSNRNDGVGLAQRSTAPSGSTIIGTYHHRHFSSTLAIKLGQSIFTAENIHLKLNEAPGIDLQRLKKMNENHVAAAPGLILVNPRGESRFLTQYFQPDFNSSLKRDKNSQARENLEQLKHWLVAIHELRDIHDFTEHDYAHGEQTLVLDLLENYQKYVDELVKFIQPGEEAVALVLDICSIPNTICAPCHRSLEALMKKEFGWSEKVLGYLARQEVKCAENFKWIVRADAREVPADSIRQHAEVEAEPLTDIDALNADIVFLEQIKNYEEIKARDQNVQVGINRLKRQVEDIEVQENSLYQVILPRNARKIRAGYVFSSGKKQWQIIYVQEGMAILDLISNDALEPSLPVDEPPLERDESRAFSAIHLPRWVHGPQQLPDDFIRAGIQNGDIIVINDVQYKVVEVKNREIRSTRNNPTGKCLFVRFHLRGNASTI